ncbi:MAG: LPXTG cell wall anchor domain-containing protein [Actinobacteria bacterium]|nr:LPXTG cell wall anchor domain-containing protein [Actinomycetota bacterium]
MALAGALRSNPVYALPDTVPVATDSVPITDETVPVATEPPTTSTIAVTTSAPATLATTTSTTIAPAALPAHVLPGTGSDSTPVVALGALLVAIGVATFAVTRSRRELGG